MLFSFILSQLNVPVVSGSSKLTAYCYWQLLLVYFNYFNTTWTWILNYDSFQRLKPVSRTISTGLLYGRETYVTTVTMFGEDADQRPEWNSEMKLNLSWVSWVTIIVRCNFVTPSAKRLLFPIICCKTDVSVFFSFLPINVFHFIILKVCWTSR